MDTPAYQRSSGVSAFVAFRPLLRFVHRPVRSTRSVLSRVPRFQKRGSARTTTVYFGRESGSRSEVEPGRRPGE
jgi:hypothetical protein